MTVNRETPRILYKGNSATMVFAFTWTSDEPSEIYVVINDVLQLEGTTYELENYLATAGGEVHITPAPTEDDRIVIYRRTPITQQVDYLEFAPFDSEVHEGQMDKDTRILQEILYAGAGFGGPVDLESIEKPAEVEIDNTGGQNAFIPLWRCNEDLAGVFAGEVVTSAPADGTLTTRPDGYMFIEVAP